MISGGGLLGEPSDALIATTGAVAFLVLVWRIIATGKQDD